MATTEPLSSASALISNSEVVVVDNGSGSIKAGFSGEDSPRSIFQAVIGAEESLRSDSFVGSQAQTRREVLSLVHPIERGIIVDWENMTGIWDYTFKNQLKIDPSSSDFPIFLTDCPLNDRSNRETMAQIMIEHFQFPAFYVCNTAVLSLFASGKTKGLVVESGEEVTNVVPVFEGYALPHAIQRLEVAGKDITSTLSHFLNLRGYNFTRAQWETIQDIKEKLCFVAVSGRLHDTQDKAYELPDGQIITVDNECRTGAVETLFNVELMPRPKTPDDLDVSAKLKSDPVGLDQMIVNAIQKCDGDLQTDLYGSVVLAGGTSTMSGFPDRILSVVNDSAPDPSIVNVIPDSQRKYASWMGGSMFASLTTFSLVQVTEQEYRENPRSIVHKKCFT